LEKRVCVGYGVPGPGLWTRCSLGIWQHRPRDVLKLATHLTFTRPRPSHASPWIDSFPLPLEFPSHLVPPHLTADETWIAHSRRPTPQVRASSIAVYQPSCTMRTTPPNASLEIHVSPDSHFTVYRFIQDSFHMFLYSPFVLDHHLHRLARSVHVHDPPRLTPAKQARIQPHFPFIFPFACVRLKHFLCPLQIPQPCRWSCECPSRSAFAFSFVSSRLIQHRTSGSRGAISCHTTHTCTHTLLCAFAFPSGTRTCFGPDLSPNSLAVWTSHLQYTFLSRSVNFL